jgi:hypothetical protein
MARAARRYDIFLPLTFNDGMRIPRKNFDAVETRLLDRFNGVTSLRRDFPLSGIWQGETRLYFDQIIVLTVFDFRRRGSGPFIGALKASLLQEFDQVEILITETALHVH